ncbi:MAG TPA: amidohydrolase family protein [Edaphobacter sp.]|jgi:L-fuconolactonase|nr:amidohydrolase family protein [Edaphobacter sp.]
MATTMWSRRQFLATSAATAIGPLQSAATPLIDAHVHVWKHDAAFPFALGANPPAEDASVEQLLDLMHANNVLRTVIIQVIHYKWDNSYLASVLKRYPRTFQGVCRVNPQDSAAPDHLSRLIEVDGFHGVRLSPSASPSYDWIRGPLMPPLWRRCSQLKVPMTILAPITRMPDLALLIEKNPDLTIVIDHMADCPIDQPDKLQLLLDLAHYPKVFVKISHLWSLSAQPYPYVDTIPQITTLVEAFGASRLMWATDWPISLTQLSYSKAVALYRDHLDFLSPADHQQILYKTVQRVWPFNVS